LGGKRVRMGMVVTRIVLVRHAAIDTGRRLCGSRDLGLSPAGRADVEALVCRRPHSEIPSALLTSTLKRAVEVACGLGRVWGLEPRAADWAREIDCGEFEGMLLEDLQRKFPELWSRNEAQAEDRFAWPGGETYAQFRARALAGLNDVAASHPSSRVVVVTHAGVVSQVLGVLKGRPACVWQPDRPRPLTATEVLWEDGRPRAVLSFNDPDWY
jgi:broad specificity phosphatase PhoE